MISSIIQTVIRTLYSGIKAFELFLNQTHWGHHIDLHSYMFLLTNFYKLYFQTIQTVMIITKWGRFLLSFLIIEQVTWP